MQTDTLNAPGSLRGSLARAATLLARPAVTLVRQGAKQFLASAELYDLDLPAHYADGATTPAEVPPAPAAATPEALAAALAGDDLDLAPTPDGFEPGLMDDLLGLSLTRENVEEALDEFVRPALNADGGDITLVDIKDGDIYVQLEGACSSCPSSTMTMRMGVERMLQEEFPDMGELIDVGASGGAYPGI